MDLRKNRELKASPTAIGRSGRRHRRGEARRNRSRTSAKAPRRAPEGRAAGSGPRMIMPDGVMLYAATRQERFLRGLAGFIADVAGALKRAVPLEDAVGQAVERHPQAAPAFELRRNRLAERFGLKSRFLFPRADPIVSLAFSSRVTQRRTNLEVENQRMLPGLARLIHLCASGAFTRNEIRAQVSPELVELVDVLEQEQMLAEVPEVPSPGLPDQPCVVRLQHAGLLFRTARTGVLVDPHFNSTYEPATLRRSIPRAAVEGKVDAILISHSHEDHFSLTSLATFHRDTPIVVPRVPRASVLASDMARRLKALGFRDVRTPAWYGRPLRFGDISVDVLPFYGEQPLVHEPVRSPLLRNWGNTYLIRTEAFRAWFLIDSGSDVEGRMADVAKEVRARHGGVDLLLSNLRRFAVGAGDVNPFYISGAGQCWLSLTPEQMRRFAEFRENVTLGPDGAAEVCRAVRARYFLPYAHWWCEPGTIGPDEPLALEEMQRYLGPRDTKLLTWNIGDAYVAVGKGRFERRPCFT